MTTATAPTRSARPVSSPQPAPRGDSWVCDNCATDNPPRRRRCSDCRTSRF